MKNSTKEIIKGTVGIAGGKALYDVAGEILSITDKSTFTAIGSVTLKMAAFFTGFGLSYKACDTCEKTVSLIGNTVKEIAGSIGTQNEEAEEMDSDTPEDSVSFTEVDD